MHEKENCCHDICIWLSPSRLRVFLFHSTFECTDIYTSNENTLSERQPLKVPHFNFIFLNHDDVGFFGEYTRRLVRTFLHLNPFSADKKTEHEAPHSLWEMNRMLGGAFCYHYDVKAILSTDAARSAGPPPRKDPAVPRVCVLILRDAVLREHGWDSLGRTPTSPILNTDPCDSA